MKKRMRILSLLLFFLFSLSACGSVVEDSEDDSDKVLFQSHSEDFKILEVFTGWGSLEEIWDNIDGKGANEHLTRISNEQTDEFIIFSNVAGNILKDPELVPSLLSTDVRNIIGHLIDPTEYYRKTPENIGAFYNEPGEVYAADFYSLLDTLWEGDNRPGDQQLIDIMEKVIAHIQDGKTNLEINEDMQELIDDILDEDFDEDFKDSAELIGKLLIQTDYPMWIDETGALLKREEIDPSNENHRNLDLGNAVKGVNSLVQWINAMLQAPETNSLIKDTAREIAKLFDPAPNSNNADKIRQLLINLKDISTKDGVTYNSTHGQYGDLYKENNNEIYADSELGILLRELQPGLVQLLSRTDRPISISGFDGNPEEEGVYILREFVNLLKGTGFDPNNVDIEKSLKVLLQNDMWGRDRVSGEGWSVSMLESTLYLSFLANNLGWTDGGTTAGGGLYTAPIARTDPRSEHGHGEHTGYMTINDALSFGHFNKMGILGLAYLGIHDLALQDSDGEHIYRSVNEFNITEKDNYRFYFNQNYPITQAMAGLSLGDIGSPDGGNPDGYSAEELSNPGSLLNTYKTYNGNGFNDNDQAAFTISWISRTCFDGEGPYYYKNPEAATITVNGGTCHKYFRPNGKIYALVNHETQDYIYPVEDGDVIDTALPQYTVDGETKDQRENRYKSVWTTDYYMMQRRLYWLGDLLPTNNKRQYTVSNDSDNLSLVEIDDSESARPLTYHESVEENDARRACSSPEEAFFRNYQWTENEKKIVILLPMFMNMTNALSALNLDALKNFLDLGEGIAFMAMEANGWSGIANLKKFNDNHVWGKKGTGGRSTIPGDYRFELVANIGGPSTMLADTDSIFDDILGTGTGMPPTVCHNLPALYRMAFPLSPEIERVTGVTDKILSSTDFEVGDEIWQDRNVLAPLIFSLTAAVHQQTATYDPATNGLNSGLRTMLSALTPLLKPLVYYQKNDGAYPRETWKPRIKGENCSNYIGDPYLMSSDDLYIADSSLERHWFGSWLEREHYQAPEVKTLLNVLIDSDLTAPEKRMDGLLPVLLEKKALTNIVKLLMSNTNNSNDFYYALEQIATSVKFTKAPATIINEGLYKDIQYPDWMFATGTTTGDFGEYTAFENVRDEDFILDKSLDKLIGHNAIPDHEGYGFTNYVTTQNAEQWVDFHKDIDKLEDFIFPQSTYSLLESTLELSDAIFARENVYSDAEIKALLYSVGKLFTYYDATAKNWVIQGDEGFKDIYNILKLRLPAIHEIVKDDTGDNYAALLSINAEMLKDNGMLDLIIDTASTDDGAESILMDLYAFLGDDISKQHDPLWSTLSNLLLDMATAIENSDEGDLREEIYNNYGFQVNQ